MTLDPEFRKECYISKDREKREMYAAMIAYISSTLYIKGKCDVLTVG